MLRMCTQLSGGGEHAPGDATRSRWRAAPRTRGAAPLVVQVEGLTSRPWCRCQSQAVCVVRERFFTPLCERMRIVLRQNGHSNSRNSVGLSLASIEDERKQLGQVTTK